MSIIDESVIDFPTAAREVRKDKPPHIATLWRWSQRGVRGVRLETAKIGGRTVTSREALRRFLERVNAAAGSPLPPSGPTAAARKADEALKRAGV